MADESRKIILPAAVASPELEEDMVALADNSETADTELFLELQARAQEEKGKK